MAGCAMIGQSVINVKSGGRGRLSTLAGRHLPAVLVMVVFVSDLVGRTDPDGRAGCRDDHGVDRHLQLGLAPGNLWASTRVRRAS
jgi:hypothetical protein